MKRVRGARCPVCRNSDSKAVYDDELGDAAPTVDYDFSPETRKTYRIVECLECAHRFVNPMPAVAHLYRDNVDAVYLASLPQRRRSAQCWLELVRTYAAPNADSLIDIGCATGVFLDEAARRYRVEGVELSRWAADLASERHEVHRLPLTELATGDAFDIATMWGVIEHLEEPRMEIKAVHHILKTAGLLFIYTGNRDGRIPRLLGKRWWWYQGMHLQYFSEATLTRLLRESGFSVVAVHRLPVFFSPESLGRSLNRYRVMRPLVWLLQRCPQRFLIRVTLSGEMVLIARKA